MSYRSLIDWLMRGWRPRAARIIAGVAVGFFGVLVFLTPGSVTAHGNNASALITIFSVILVAGGLVIIVGPDRINEMARRSRRG